MTGILPLETPKPASAPIRSILIRGGQDSDKRLIRETSDKAEHRPPAEKQGGPPVEANSKHLCWIVPRQDEVIVFSTFEGTIEIEQKSPLGQAEDQRVIIVTSNAVQVARMILWAAGWRSILIATGDDGRGYRDLEDGDLADDPSDTQSADMPASGEPLPVAAE
jgi:hypothetical protein